MHNNKHKTKEKENDRMEIEVLDESRVSEAPAERVWSDGLILLLHIILPIAITGAIIGRKAIFSRLWTHLDKSFIAVLCPSFSKREKLKKWMTDYLPNVDGGLIAMWKDGSLMCTLINSVVPGACPNPHRHWKKPPIHGQALAYKYLGVIPVFSDSDFLSSKPTAIQEKLLIDYICSLQAAIDKMASHSDITFSTRYIARGMGLVTGEQHRKTVVYIYPNFKGQTLDDLLVNIRGPYNTYGSTTLKAISFTVAQDKSTKLPDKRQSFLKSLSADFSNLLKPKDKGPACDIEIKTEFEKERAKLIFVPNNSGVYEICLTTNGEHIAGSPFNLSVEKNRSGITQGLNDIVEVRTKQNGDAKQKKKVLNTVIYYEKLRKSNNEVIDFALGKFDSDTEEKENDLVLRLGKQDLDINQDDKCKIMTLTDENCNTPLRTLDCLNEIEKKEVEEPKTVCSTTSDEEFTLPILETLEKLNDLLESTEKLNEVQDDKPNNFGLNIIDTLRNIPELKKIESSSSSNELNVNITNSNEQQLKDNSKFIKKETNNNLQQKDLTFSLFEETKTLGSFEEPKTLNNNAFDEPKTLDSFEENKETEEIVEVNQVKTNHDNLLQHNQDLYPAKLIYPKPNLKQENEEQSCLADSGTYVNDDIDPDSLSSSLEMQEMQELQGSSEEISFSGASGSDTNEVNNNDIMVKSNEDICYLILNQNPPDRHKRVYSRDFISCKDEQSKDDLSKSDPNLHREEEMTPNSVSALSQGNVQEAHNGHATMSSGMFQTHSQEGLRIAARRSHSYSHGSLLDSSNDGNEFKQHFLKRKAFWTNISMSNMSLAERPKSKSRDVVDSNLGKSVNDVNNVVKNLARSESAKNLELRSRSLDYVKQRKKLDVVSRDSGGRFGSVDDLNFPSVRHRRDQYLNEQKNQTSCKSLDRQELYAVRGEKYTWSIHDKIKSFENGPESLTPVPHDSTRKLHTLPENITVTTNIKERFEKAQTYFKHLETKSTTVDKRRHSLDGEGLRLVVVDPNNQNKEKVTHGNTVAGVAGLRLLNGRNDPVITEDNELQRFVNDRRKRKHTRMPAVDVFN